SQIETPILRVNSSQRLIPLLPFAVFVAGIKKFERARPQLKQAVIGFYN
ncbi:hypothetical protein Tsubulata_003018, partial [Turnera subulata]